MSENERKCYCILLKVCENTITVRRVYGVCSTSLRSKHLWCDVSTNKNKSLLQILLMYFFYQGVKWIIIVIYSISKVTLLI
jgi:hypothetical protein